MPALQMIYVGLLLFASMSPGLGQIQLRAKHVSAIPDSFCYAFLLRADLYTHCGGETYRITRTGDVLKFALSTDGSTLALWRYTSGKRPSDRRAAIQIVSLVPNYRTVTRKAGSTGLFASCGTILELALEPGATMRHSSWDAVTHTRLSYPPYKTFRCSSDRQTIIGIMDDGRTVLKAGFPPQRVIVRAQGNFPVFTYDVSPAGHIAYLAKDLCVERGVRSIECVAVRGTYPDKISLSDSMGVLYDGGLASGETCYFDASGRWSLKHLPGYDEEDECVGVGYWRPGSTPTMLEMFGSYPQWINAQAAAALRSWRSYLDSRVRHRRRNPLLP